MGNDIKACVILLCSLCVVDRYLPQVSSLQSETVHFKRGVCQQFCLPSHYVNLSEWADEEVTHLLAVTFCVFAIYKEVKIGQTELICPVNEIIEQLIMHILRALWVNLVMWFIVTQLLFDMDKDIYPMVVQAVVDAGDGEFYVIGYFIIYM